MKITSVPVMDLDALQYKNNVIITLLKLVV